MSETILSDGGTSCIEHPLKMGHYQSQCKHCICPMEIHLSTNTKCGLILIFVWIINNFLSPSVWLSKISLLNLNLPIPNASSQSKSASLDFALSSFEVSSLGCQSSTKNPQYPIRTFAVRQWRIVPSYHSI